jgi:hypothetical protein
MEEKSTHECKNCSTEIEGQFCHFCGQRYHDHKESFGELAYEFVSDFLHFDSRFFRTVLPLIFQPGKLTKSYNEGKQRSQFHPIRLYLFSSFVYFFLFFAFTNVEDQSENEGMNNNKDALIIDSVKHQNLKDSLKLADQNEYDSSGKEKTLSDLNKEIAGSVDKKLISGNDSLFHLTYSSDPYIDSLLHNKVSPGDYMKQQNMLTKEKKDGYLRRIFIVKILKINMKGQEGKKEFFNKLTETFLHNIPKTLFFLLPIFAFFLKLLYFRKKQFYYVDHAILSLHYFSLIFILLILSNYILDAIFGTGIFTFLAFVWITAYMLIAMKRLYGEKWGRTVFKFFTLGFLLFFAIIVTLIGNMAWTAFMI